MATLFVVKSIEINAPADKVWKILTEQEFIKQWVEEGWKKAGVEDMTIFSDWKPGNKVLWKNKSGDVLLVEGSITALNPYKLLRFTVFDVRSKEKFSVSEEDGITFKLAEQNGYTMLEVRQGDFSVMKEGKKYHQQTDEIWERVLPKVKALTEANTEAEEQPTCGKGLAANSVFLARFSEVITSMAENLELHMETLDLNDANARLEYKVYQNLASEHRDIASRLMATAKEMYSCYDLPMGKHDESKLSNPEIGDAFKKFTSLEVELIALLQKHMKTDKKILAEIAE